MWWQQYPERYRKELDALQKHFPGIRLSRATGLARFCVVCKAAHQDSTIHLAAFVRIQTRFDRIYPVVMVYPCDFPNRIPGVWTLDDLDPQPPHQYSDNRICLTHNEFDPSVSGCIVLGWAYGWLNCYDLFVLRGNFPDTNYGKHSL